MRGKWVGEVVGRVVGQSHGELERAVDELAAAPMSQGPPGCAGGERGGKTERERGSACRWERESRSSVQLAIVLPLQLAMRALEL